MTDHFNGLTPAEAERLAMLAEEASEIVQIAMKVLRHGYASHHPEDPQRTPNVVLLRREMTDLRAVWEMMLDASDNAPLMPSEIVYAKAKKMRYAHHQGASA